MADPAMLTLQMNLVKAHRALKAADVPAFLEALTALWPDLKIIRGKDGKTPVKGKDYMTPAERSSFVDEVLKRVRMPKDGKTPVKGVDYPDAAQIEGMIRALVNEIEAIEGEPGHTPQKGIDYMTPEDIWNLRDRVVESVMPQLRGAIDDAIKRVPRTVETRSLPQVSLFGGRGGGGGSRTIEVWNGSTPIGQDIRKIIFEGAGVSAARIADGVAVVTITGGAAGASVSTEKLTPIASGSDITLDLTALAHTFVTIQWVAKNGQILDPADATFGWSRASNTITVLNAADTDIFMVAYTY